MRAAGGIELKAKRGDSDNKWLIRRYHLDKQQALAIKRMLDNQRKTFIANLKSGMSPHEAVENLQVSDSVKESVAQILAQAASSGVQQAQSTLQSTVEDAADVPHLQMPLLTVDWKLINDDAVRFAREYSYSEIKGITDTTRRLLREKVSDWIISGKPLQELMRDKGVVHLFGANRARMIAVTEVTRVYAEANQIVFQQTGVQKRRWNTAHDEIVCPICGPLNETVVGITEPFGAGISLPPAHPNCRCWITPEVVEERETQEPAGEQLPSPAITATVPATQPPPEPDTHHPPPDDFPSDIDKLVRVHSLGGSTGAILVEDPATGKRYVMKRGKLDDPGHIREEAAADAAYQALGVRVPKFKLYETDDGPVKLAEFIEGDLLNKIDKTTQRYKDAIEALRKDFAADVLLANWDVAGMDLDNIIVDKQGQVWRIDNGGALRYRAQGNLKGDKWSDHPVELWSMRDPRNISGRIFGDMVYRDVVPQMHAIAAKRDAVLAVLPDEVKTTVARRLDALKDLATISDTLTSDGWTWSYADMFAKHTVGLRQAGIVARLPKEFTNAGVIVTDENGREWDDLRGQNSIMFDVRRYIEDNGGNFDLLRRWQYEQGSDSWSKTPKALKYWIATQRGGEYDKYFWKDGFNKTRAIYEQFMQAYGKDEFDATFSAWHAFNHELMRNVAFKRNNIEGGFVELVRTESSKVIRKYKVKQGKDREMLRGACESSSIYKTVVVAGDQLTLQRVPHHRIMGCYFYEGVPGSGKPPFLGDNENEFVFMTGGIKFDYVGGTSKGISTDRFWQ